VEHIKAMLDADLQRRST